MDTSGAALDDAHRFSPASPEESYVFGSCAPGWHSACDNDTAVSQWLSFVQSRGIERVCCLFAGTREEVRDPYLQRYSDVFGSENVCHVPTAPSRLIERDGLAGEIFPFLKQSVDRESPVVVQCLSGVDRTGQVLAAWLVAYHGYDPEPAIRMVREMGRDPMGVVECGNATEDHLFDLLETVSV